jgi:hypothetical protein
VSTVVSRTGVAECALTFDPSPWAKSVVDAPPVGPGEAVERPKDDGEGMCNGTEEEKPRNHQIKSHGHTAKQTSAICQMKDWCKGERCSGVHS